MRMPGRSTSVNETRANTSEIATVKLYDTSPSQTNAGRSSRRAPPLLSRLRAALLPLCALLVVSE